MIIQGDCVEVLKTLPEKSVNACVTSPPYFGLRDYGTDGQIGLEASPEAFVAKMVEVFREVKRVLRDDGTVWLNLGDSYATKHSQGATDSDKGWKSGALGGERQRHHGRANGGDLPSKNLLGIPWRVAFALQADGWYLRQDLIWHKPNPMPESVRDRCTKAHEYIFLLSKKGKYYFDNDAIREPYKTNKEKPNDSVVNGRFSEGERDYYSMGGRNKRSVWTVTTKPYKGAHFATFPTDLIKPCVIAGSPEGGTVLDPFFGAGTTGLVAKQNRRKYIGIELNHEYIELAKRRISNEVGNMF